MPDEENEDARFQAEEKVLYNHLECVKQEARLITVEGEIITKLENAMGEGVAYNMDDYLATAEQIAQQKLAMYSDLVSKIQEFKQHYRQP